MAVLFTLTSIKSVREHKVFLKENHKALSQSDNHLEMFSLLNFYWNYLAYHLLEQLIEALNLEEPAFDPVSAEMTAYKDDIHKFMRQTTLVLFCQAETTTFDEDPPPGFRKMVVKFDWPRTATLEDVERFRRRYASSYDLQTCAMMLNSIGTGSFTVSWFIAVSAVEMLRKKRALSVLKEFSVIRLEIHASTVICVYQIFTQRPVSSLSLIFNQVVCMHSLHVLCIYVRDRL